MTIIKCIGLVLMASCILIFTEGRHFHRTDEEALNTRVSELTKTEHERVESDEARRKVNKIIQFLILRYPRELFAVLEANAWPSVSTVRRRAAVSQGVSPILEYGRVIKKDLDNLDKKEAEQDEDLVLKPGSFRIMRRTDTLQHV